MHLFFYFLPPHNGSLFPHVTSCALMILLVHAIIASAVAASSSINNNTVNDAAAGRQPGYYLQQLVDHIGDHSTYWGRTWKHRFYTMGTHFGGPGYPIFVYLGGEGSIEPDHSLGYPYYTDHIARVFRGFILQPEHRFYGASQPISREEIDEARANGDPDPRLDLLTSEQALHDYIRLIRAVRDQLMCSRDRFSPSYCPVIAVGGSYPGWLAAMARLLFPSVVDMAHASSAPMKFYAQQVPQDAYFDHMTQVTDRAFPGCAAAVRHSLEEAAAYYSSPGALDQFGKIGVCPGTLPEYYIKDTTVFMEEMVMVVAFTFANMNMAFYPPSPHTRLGRACHTFLQNSTESSSSSLDKISQFLVDELGDASASSGVATPCFNLTAQLPTGPKATLSSGDWSGVGSGPSGESWDFQTCTLLVETIGFSKASFLLPRSWTMEWLNQHCRARFGVTPQPMALVESWGFDDLISAGASHIVFTNGMLDGWSVSGVMHNVSDTLIALNFPNGAHHSDLSYFYGLQDNATHDIQEGRAQIQTLLSEWLAELPGGRHRHK